MRVEQMIATHPHVRGDLNPALARCIEACFDCGQVCVSCADACLGEEMVAELVQCIRLDLDCADACFAAGKIATRRSGGDVPLIRLQLQACELAHQISALAIDALGELGVLYDGAPHLRAHGVWQQNYMFQLGLIIGGGTAQIQKNIIAERGLGMPREPRPATEGGH